jgi:chemotaxis protein CheD
VTDDEIRVKVADWAAARGEGTIVTLGLGSCVAIMLHARDTRVAALAHVLLPDETFSRAPTNPAKFATSAVPLLLAEMRARGARGPIVAKLAGGASMFGALLPAGGVNMGERNADAARRHRRRLRALGLPGRLERARARPRAAARRV